MRVLTKFYNGEDATAENFNICLVDADFNFDICADRDNNFESRITVLEDYTPPAPPVEVIVGTMIDYAGIIAPEGWIECNGAAVSRSTYAALFAVLCPSIGSPSISIASPAVFTLSAHGMRPGDTFYLTGGTLPTGLSANTIYYVIAGGFSANSFEAASTRSGTAINTSGSQLGQHSLYRCPWGLGDGSTTFNLPDSRGRTSIGAGAGAGCTERTAGEQVGVEKVELKTSNMPTNAPILTPTLYYSNASYVAGASLHTGLVDNATGGGGIGVGVMQPSLTYLKLIKY